MKNILLLVLCLTTIVSTAQVTKQIGETVTYTLSAKNNGTQVSSSATVTQTLPSGVTYVSNSAGATVSGSTLTWNVGSLAVNQTKTNTVICTANTVGTHNSTATIVGVNNDNIGGNNSDNVNIVITLADADGDGIPDASDTCPNTFGVASNAGCPVPTGTLANDTPPASTIGTPFTFDVGTNDNLNCNGTTQTYTVTNIVGCTVTGTYSNYTITPSAATYSFDVNGLCGGVIASTSTISGTSAAAIVFSKVCSGSTTSYFPVSINLNNLGFGTSTTNSVTEISVLNSLGANTVISYGTGLLTSTSDGSGGWIPNNPNIQTILNDFVTLVLDANNITYTEVLWDISSLGFLNIIVVNPSSGLAINSPVQIFGLSYTSELNFTGTQNFADNQPYNCAAATYTDGIQNGTETGIDCGGSCPNSCVDPLTVCDPGDYMDGGRVLTATDFPNTYSVRSQVYINGSPLPTNYTIASVDHVNGVINDGADLPAFISQIETELANAGITHSGVGFSWVENSGNYTPTFVVNSPSSPVTYPFLISFYCWVAQNGGVFSCAGTNSWTECN